MADSDRCFKHLLSQVELEMIYRALDMESGRYAEKLRAQSRLSPEKRSREVLLNTRLCERICDGLLSAFEDAIEDYKTGCRVELRIIRPTYTYPRKRQPAPSTPPDSAMCLVKRETNAR